MPDSASLAYGTEGEKLIDFAQQYAGGRVGVMLDADHQGDEGAKDLLWRMHVRNLDAYLVWSRTSQDGRYRDRQPESLADDEWNELAEQIRKQR